MSHASALIEQDILAYLQQHENKELLRFITCGSVDDGKSTLIGRLLHDSKMIFEDHLAAIENDSKKVGTTGEQVDLALLVDGLQSEREQGITIDVAYRYFSTEKRKFIIADTPGHEQYTRNMATGASTADVAIILIDARYGVQTQTKRHSFITSLLGIKTIIVAVNKMDLVDYSEARFDEIKAAYEQLAESLHFSNIIYTPISALNGDNVVNASAQMPWFTGQPLMNVLETVPVNADDDKMWTLRFPVQYVNRPHLNYRGFAGTIASGKVKVGDQVTVLPSGVKTRIKSIDTFEGQLAEAEAPLAVTLTTTDEVDISRGDMLVHREDHIRLSNTAKAHLVWMAETPMQLDKEYLIKFATKTTPGQVDRIEYKVDVNTLNKQPTEQLALNEIGVVDVSFSQVVAFDAYKKNRQTGAFILIDRLTNGTVGAGMIIDALESKKLAASKRYSEAEIALNRYIREHYPEWQARAID